MKASTLWKLSIIILLVLILGRFLIVGQAKVLFNTISSDGDESAYLTLGLNLLEDGKLTDGVRPPLYPLLLAPLAEREWAYFTRAKMMTLGLGALAVLVTFLVGQSLFNWETGLLAAFMLAANKEFHLRASTVYADTLLVALFVAAWYFLIRSFEKPRFAYLAGFLAGLAYLTKGTAGLLLLAWGLAAVLRYRGRIAGQKQLLIVPIIFLLTVSPLLLYNLTVFGRPFYNFATTHVMWMDRWSESQVANPANLPTFSSYLQSHTPADMVERLQFGVARLNPVLAKTLIPARTLNSNWLGSGLLIVAFMLVGWLFAFKRNRVWAAYNSHKVTIQVSLLLFIPFYLFSAWYARVLVESRFLIPVLGPFYILLAAIVIALGQNILRSRPFQRGSVNSGPRPEVYRGIFYSGLAVAVIWGVWWLAATAQADSWSLTVNPFDSDRQANTAPETVLAWFERDSPAELGEARIIFGPSKSLPLWKFPQRFNFERTPVDVDTWSGFQDYVQQISANYLIIDSDTARRRRTSLSDHFSYQQDGIEFEHIPAGWSLAYLHGDRPYTWAIFQPPSLPATSLTANFGDQIELLGYDVIAAGNGPGRVLRLSIYWQALTPLEKNYTMFLHLTAADGFVKAQRDQQPLNGLWPTSRWGPGEIVADRYEIILDDSVQPGAYLLVTGLYELPSGERLPLLDGPPSPSPNAVLLGEIEFK